VARIKSTGAFAGAVAAAALAFPAFASAASGTVNGTALTVTSTAPNDPIAVTCGADDKVKINGADASPATDCAVLTSITVTGDDGANAISLAAVNAADFGALTSVTINGGRGNDTIGGSQLADRLVGGDNNDDVAGAGGDDTIVWNGGDDDDINEGGDGVDTIEVNGANAFGETFSVTPGAVAGRVRFDRLAPTPNPPGFFNLDIGTSERLDLRMNGGDDTFSSNGDIDALGFKITVDGGDGTDTIDGSNAADVLKGGNGDDRIVPDDNPPNTHDDARGDAGNDTIVWNGGDDNDLNDGGDGVDTTQVNGAPVGETFTVKPGAPGHVLFARVPPTPDPPGFFDIDITTTESLDLNMNGGDDTVTADPGFTAPALDVDGGDGNDTSVLNGAPTAETFTIRPSATAGRVQLDRTSPSPLRVDLGTTEHLRLNAAGGDDTIKGFAGIAGLIETELNGDDGNDRVRGTDAEDRLNGGKGHDVLNSRDHAEDLLDCGPGLDLAFIDRRDFLRNCNIVIGGHLRVRAGAKTLVASGGMALLPLTCAGTPRCKGALALRRGGKTLATGKFNIKHRSKTVRLKLNRRGLRLLAHAPAKGYKVSLRIDAHDARGNGWRSTSPLRLKGERGFARGRPLDAGGLGGEASDAPPMVFGP
jgi:Ca2+-binding RTX toxin-like protein